MTLAGTREGMLVRWSWAPVAGRRMEAFGIVEKKGLATVQVRFETGAIVELNEIQLLTLEAVA